jgi:hypothetical protein
MRKPGLLFFVLLSLFGCEEKGPQSYDDCILENVSDGMNELAVQAVLRSCREKFPEAASSQSEKRPLTANELRNLSGRAGLEYGSQFGGKIYNGNDKIQVTRVKIRVGTVSEGREGSRIYQDDVDIGPNSTSEFSFEIIPGDKDAEYNWWIESARGRPLK